LFEKVTVDSSIALVCSQGIVLVVFPCNSFLYQEIRMESDCR